MTGQAKARDTNSEANPPPPPLLIRCGTKTHRRPLLSKVYRPRTHNRRFVNQRRRLKPILTFCRFAVLALHVLLLSMQIWPFVVRKTHRRNEERNYFSAEQEHKVM